MEVGPLARVLMLYASGHEPTKDLAHKALTQLDLPLEAMFSTLGRTAARTLECKIFADAMPQWYQSLMANIKAGDVRTFNETLWEPSTWPSHAQGVGFTEAPRGALAHWIVIDDGKITNYQAVVPSTWNAGPRDAAGTEGPYEAALKGQSVQDPKQPLEILRTIHSFDPCIACAVHVVDPDGEELIQVRVQYSPYNSGLCSVQRVRIRICCCCTRRASTISVEKAILYGPVSDMVPSSTVFEMYPLGFLTIASYLHDRGMQVRIVNLALRMMNSRRFDVPRFLARQKPKAVGIDLHWLPHAHGALEVARIVKELHPDVPVIMGGLSSSYFHRELIGYPQVDYVLRGDSTEPPLHQLLMALRQRRARRRDPESHLEGCRRHSRQSPHVRADEPGLRRSAARSDGRDGDALPRSGKHPALQRLVEQPDHDGVHRQGLRLRMRHLRQLAHDLHPLDEAAKARVSQSRKLGRQHASDFPSDAWPDRSGRRPAAWPGPSTRPRSSNACA